MSFCCCSNVAVDPVIPIPKTRLEQQPNLYPFIERLKEEAWFANIDTDRCAEFLSNKLREAVVGVPIRLHTGETPFPKGLHITENGHIYLSSPEKYLVGRGANKKIKRCWDLFGQQWIARITPIAMPEKRAQEMMSQEIDALNQFQNQVGVQELLDSTVFQDKNEHKKVAMFQPLAANNLFQAMERNVLSYKEKISIAKQLLQTLINIHKKGSHGDIKPENILIDQFKNATIIDFGAYVKKESADHEPIINKATLPYVSPDSLRIDTKSLDTKKMSELRQKADIWALGITFMGLFFDAQPPWFRYLTSAKAVYKRSVKEAIQHEIKHLPDDWLTVCRLPQYSAVAEIIKEMLQVKPDKRISARKALVLFENLDFLA